MSDPLSLSETFKHLSDPSVSLQDVHQLYPYRIVFPGVGSTDYDDEEYSDGDYDEDDADKNETKNDIMLGAGASDRLTAKTPLKGPLTYDGRNNLGSPLWS